MRVLDGYTAQVIVYVLISAFLVFSLLVGGMLVLNLGLMSKRHEDRRGGRAPSDVAILKNEIWPQVPYEEKVLPALDDEYEQEVLADRSDREGIHVSDGTLAGAFKRESDRKPDQAA